LAQRSADWAKKLQLGATQDATGIWLVGAFDMSLGNLDASRACFSQLYKATPAPELVLLTDGYEVIAKSLRAKSAREDIEKNLERVSAHISTSCFYDGAEWFEQLRTALMVFQSGVNPT
ncbi:hypothetical protein GQ53DRAFT_666913, partial [Thozetella sp. PMI_491]